uniref:Uncharacterized protein n=1 Tax=Kalanchoe fedtschenkoi TaxID=63787 RepID=A0A7N0V8Y1_KALFE
MVLVAEPAHLAVSSGGDPAAILSALNATMLTSLDIEGCTEGHRELTRYAYMDKGHTLPLGLPQVMMALTRDGQLYDHLKTDVEKRHGVSFEEEREKRAYMKGLEHGIHPLANGGGKGVKLVIRETDCKPPQQQQEHHENSNHSVPREVSLGQEQVLVPHLNKQSLKAELVVVVNFASLHPLKQVKDEEKVTI